MNLVKPFENVPSSWIAIIVPWIISLTMLYFDFVEGYRTTPVLIFGFPIFVTIIFMPKESFKSIKEALGLAMPTLKDKLINVAGVIIGLVVGAGLYFGLTVLMNLQILYFLPASTLATTGILGIGMIYMVVAVGEETMRVLYMKIAANKLSEYGMGMMEVVLISALISGGFWASLHYFAYGGINLQTLPSYVIAWGLGNVFALISIGLAKLAGKDIWYFIAPAIAAHLIFNILTAFHLSIVCFGLLCF